MLCKTSRLLWLLQLILNLSYLKCAHAQGTIEDAGKTKDFLMQIEDLVLNTFDDALEVTRFTYQNLSAELLNAQLKQSVQPIIDAYLMEVAVAVNAKRNYSLKRQSLQKFKWSNTQILELRKKQTTLGFDMPQFHFQLISNDFLYNRKNTTKFDNLYLHFMQEFEIFSEKFCEQFPKPLLENEQLVELLELLKEIKSEQNLRMRDKLYDEFIEMYLFKDEATEARNKELI